MADIIDECIAKAKLITTDPEAKAYYACKMFNAIAENAKTNLAIAGVQQVAAFYFADKQHDVAKQSQNRLDDTWYFNKDIAKTQFEHWNQHARPEEIEQLQKASDREEKGYTVDYETAKNRILADVRGEYGRARDKLLRERKAYCVGANRHAHRQLNITEARAAVSAINQAYRAEEQRKDLKEAQYREELYKWIGVFRNSIGDSLNASKSASAAAAARGQINPYEGWLHAFGGLSGLGNSYFAYNNAQAYGGVMGIYQQLFNAGTNMNNPIGTIIGEHG